MPIKMKQRYYVPIIEGEDDRFIQRCIVYNRICEYGKTNEKIQRLRPPLIVTFGKSRIIVKEPTPTDSNSPFIKIEGRGREEIEEVKSTLEKELGFKLVKAKRLRKRRWE